MTLLLLTTAQPAGYSRREDAPELGVYEPCANPGFCDPKSGLSRLKHVGANAVLVTVVDADGRALYPSEVLPMKEGVDPNFLREVLDEARRLGIRVYAWVNLPHEVWLERHPEWIAVLSDGRPADYYSGDYFHRIVSPARVVRERECVETLRALFREVASMGFDGIDVNDNFQFSDQYFEEEDVTLLTSYDEFTVGAFEEDTGIFVPGSSPSEWADYIESNEDVWKAWVRWRAEQVTKLLEIIVSAVREVDPDLPVRPHLLIWDPLETYGLDFPALARLTDTLYVMVPPEESRLKHLEAVRMAGLAGARVVIASTYLDWLSETDDPIREAARRARWLASAGADGIFVFRYGLAEEESLWDLVKAVFEEFRHVWERRAGAYPEWLWGARAASVYLEPGGQTGEDVDSLVRTLASQGVTLVELDVGLSSYETMYDESEFERALKLVKAFTSSAHARGLRVVVYLPALEIVSDLRGRVFSRERSAWLQRSLDGRPLAVSGAELEVPWLDPTSEDAWVSPLSPHRQVVCDRAARLISEGGADGIWLDVPHMPSYLTEELSDLWPDASEWGVQSFEERYWEEPPSEPDWSDLAFRKWIAWRHEAVLDFVLEVADAVVEAGGVLLVESSACDHGGTELAFDPTLLRWNPTVILVPEVGPPEWERGLFKASFREWTDFYAMLKHARACSPLRPFLPLTYGLNPEDSSRQLGLVLAIADGFFETDSADGLMTGSVGTAFREKAFYLVSLLKGPRESQAKVAVLFSRATRDYVDRYVYGPYDVSDTTHMAAFRRVVEVLARAHVQFDVLPVDEMDPSELSRYEVVIAPQVRCLSRGARLTLEEYSGNLLRIGTLGDLDEYGWPASPLNIGVVVLVEDLPQLLSDYASAVEAPEGVLVEETSLQGCHIAVAVNVASAEGSLKVPRGVWVLDFDSWSAAPVDDAVETPKTFAVVVLRGEIANNVIDLSNAVVIASSPVDEAFNPELRQFASEGISAVVVRLGGPLVDPAGWSGAEVEFIRESGSYASLSYPNGTLRARYGVEDYAVVWVTRCGDLTLVRAAGVTRYGTRAALTWLLNSPTISGEYTVLRWLDDGDGVVEMSEVTVVASW